MVADETTRIVVKGVRPYDGEYELDTGRAFNAREWNWIKRIAGYMPNTISDGFRGGDPDLYVALTVIAMARAGRIDRAEGPDVAEVLKEEPFQMEGGAITVVFPDVEDDSPLVLTGQPEQLSPTGLPSDQSSSGDSSPTSSDPSDKTPSSTGTIESDMSSRRPVPTLSAS
jgi:hypothetical protein